jgi:hypothetical protein
MAPALIAVRFTSMGFGLLIYKMGMTKRSPTFKVIEWMDAEP